jgi:HEAT repeat protein
MRSFSDGTRSILQHLGALFDARHARAPARETAQNLRAMGSVVPEAIPALLAFLCDESPVVSRAAAEGIDASILACDPMDLVRLDAVVRCRSEWRQPGLTARDVVPLSHGLVGVMGLLSFNGNGYVRQAAVEALAAVTDGRELPFLLLRVADWVEPVRFTAYASVHWRIRGEWADAMVRCLPLVERLEGQDRARRHALTVLIKDMLQTSTFRPALRRALAGPRRDTRRLAFELLAKSAGEDALQVLYEGLTVADLAVRLRAARELRRRLRGDALRGMLERLKLDPFMPVRREALAAFAEQLPESAPAELGAALLDRCAAMRYLAQFHLRSGAEDLAALYRDRIRDAQGAKLRAAVAGLGETGSAPDAADLLRFLSHPEPGVRRAAVRAVGRLDGDANIDVLLAAVQDPSPGVVRAARDAVAPRIHLVQPAWLETILEGRAEPHVRRAALALAAELRWWDGAPLLIRAASSDDEATRELARRHIRRWGRNEGRLTSRPTGLEVSRLEEAVERHGASLDPRVRDDLLGLVSLAKRPAP